VLSQGLDDEEGEGAPSGEHLCAAGSPSTSDVAPENIRTGIRGLHLVRGGDWTVSKSTRAQVLLPCRRLQDPGASMRLTLSRCETCVASFLVLEVSSSLFSCRDVLVK
jgi:hypothetical protein